MSIFDLSESKAEWLYFGSYIAVLMFSVLAAIAAFGLFWGERAIARYADARTAENERLTAEAHASAADANEGLAKANLEIEDRKQENLKLSLQLRQRYFDRLEIPMELEMGIWKARAHIKVILLYADDPEAIRTASLLSFALNRLDWEVTECRSDPLKCLEPGIVVDCMTGAGSAAIRDVADEVVNALAKWSIRARTASYSLPPDTLQIRVGVNPASEVKQIVEQPPMTPLTSKEIEQRRLERRAANEASEKERADRDAAAAGQGARADQKADEQKAKE